MMCANVVLRRAALSRSLVSDARAAVTSHISSPPAPITPTAAATPRSSLAPPPPMDIPPAQDPLLAYITNRLMNDGRRTRASAITSRLLLHIHAFTRAPPLPVIREAFLKAQPAVKCLMHRQGSKTVAKPVALGEKDRTRWALNWMLKASKGRPGKTLEERLAREIVAILEGTHETNGVLREKHLAHTFAMVNRGNAQWRR